jgi:hypothetical protein
LVVGCLGGQKNAFVVGERYFSKGKIFEVASTFAKSHFSNALAMTKPIRFVSPFLLLASLIFLFGCGKEETGPTVIKGRVTDKKTGEPVRGAYIQCSSTIGSPPNEVSTDRSTSTDTDGKYEIVIPSDERVSFANVYEPGYLPKIDPSNGNFVQNGDTIIVNVQLIPTDGFLRLILKNDTGQNDSIFVTIYNETVFSEGLGLEGPTYPTVLTVGNLHEEILAFPSEETIGVYWDFERFKFPKSLFLIQFFYLKTTPPTSAFPFKKAVSTLKNRGRLNERAAP